MSAAERVLVSACMGVIGGVVVYVVSKWLGLTTLLPGALLGGALWGLTTLRFLRGCQ